PFAFKGSAQWATNVPNATLSGAPSLAASFSGFNSKRPLQQVDLFVDGKYFATLTNITPRAGNVLNLELNGYPLTYTVPTNATLGSVATDLATLINTPGTQSATKV